MIKIFNSLTKKKTIIKKRNLKLFVCGPTVYDFSHIGHARIYIFFDAFVRFLRKNGYKVKFLMNITDVDDKIINKAKELNKSPFYIARKYEKEFLKDIELLKIKVDKFARASQHIDVIIKQIKKLIEKSYAYVTKSGSVYFRTKKFKDYGKLSGQDINQLKDIEKSEEKEDPLDFALWKGRTEKSKFEPVWKAPWGYGRPGWHIEDTAITEKYFGVQYDIHGGGIDLIFPHHECEIAQQEAASGKKPFVKIWMHVNLLYVEGKKMSKSLGNFITIRDFSKIYPLRFLRFFILAHHWRAIIDYNQNTVNDLWNKYIKINEFITKLEQFKINKKIKYSKLKKEIQRSLEDDFNTSKVINLLLEEINKIEGNQEIGPDLSKILQDLDQIFVCFYPWQKLNKKLLALISKRERLRQQKKYEEADKIRDFLKSKFVYLQDTKSGPLIINLN
jgi:cysteinyl-tRNA synthetase